MNPGPPDADTPEAVSGPGLTRQIVEDQQPSGRRASLVWVFRHIKSAPFTLLMAGVILTVFTAAWIGGGDAGTKAVFDRGEMVTDRFLAGEWWLLLTSDIVHGNWSHVCWNAVGFIVLGFLLEPGLGTLRTALIFILGSLGATAGTLAFSTNGGGASGGIFALTGAYLSRPIRWRKSGRSTMGYRWLAVAWWMRDVFYLGTEYGNVGHEAHLGGFIVGLCAGALFDDRGKPVFGNWTRPRRFAAAVLVSLGLIIALAPNHRWILGWNRNRARWAERTEGYQAAEPYWAAIEEHADLWRNLDAVFLQDAARFRFREKDFFRARVLMTAVAPILDEAQVYRDAGFLLADYEPTDMRRAVRYWRKAAWLDSGMPEVMDAIAWAIVSENDSTLGTPGEALDLAKRAVALDRMRTPEFLHTLAWAYHNCGETDRGIAWMRRAIAKKPEDAAMYASDLAILEQERDARAGIIGSRQPSGS